MLITKHLVKNLAKLCTISYCSQETVEQKFLERPINNDNHSVYYQCNNMPKLYSCERDSQMYVCHYDNHLVVVFRGTESTRDVLTDLNAIRVGMPLPNMPESKYPLVHWGFLNQFNELRPELDPIIEKYVKKMNDIKMEEIDIIFTGHSLGGALATIASLNYASIYPNINVSCVTFGSPRVGDAVFRNYFSENIVNSCRFVNDNDPIPCIPTAWRYRHVDGCVWIHEDTVKNEITAWRSWRFFKNYMLSFVGYGYDASKDHSCQGYVDDLDYLPDNYFD